MKTKLAWLVLISLVAVSAWSLKADLQRRSQFQKVEMGPRQSVVILGVTFGKTHRPPAPVDLRHTDGLIRGNFHEFHSTGEVMVVWVKETLAPDSKRWGLAVEDREGRRGRSRFQPQLRSNDSRQNVVGFVFDWFPRHQNQFVIKVLRDKQTEPIASYAVQNPDPLVARAAPPDLVGMPPGEGQSLQLVTASVGVPLPEMFREATRNIGELPPTGTLLSFKVERPPQPQAHIGAILIRSESLPELNVLDYQQFGYAFPWFKNEHFHYWLAGNLWPSEGPYHIQVKWHVIHNQKSVPTGDVDKFVVQPHSEAKVQP